MSYDDCPECGREDLGWEMSDVRASLTINGCRCEPECVCTPEDLTDLNEGECVCEECGCDCDHTSVKVRIRRVFDRECQTCLGVDYRCVFDVLLDNERVKTFASEDAADAFVAKVFPTAKLPERDLAWESERGLRIAEGWGC